MDTHGTTDVEDGPMGYKTDPLPMAEPEPNSLILRLIKNYSAVW